MSSKQKGALFFSLSMISIGSTAPISSEVLRHFPIFFGVSAILLSTSISLLPFLTGIQTTLKSLTRSDWKLLFLQSLLGVVLFRIFFFYAIQFSGPVEAGVINSLTPAIMVGISYFFFRDTIKPLEIGGVLLAVFGVLIMKSDLFLTSHQNVTLWGTVFALFAAILDTVFILTGSKLPSKLNPFHKTSIVIAVSLICLLPMGIWEGAQISWNQISLTSWIPVLLYGVVSNPISYICLFMGGGAIPTALSGTLTSFIPLSTLFFSYLLTDTKPTTYHLVGTAVVVLSIIFISRSHSKSPPHST